MNSFFSKLRDLAMPVLGVAVFSILFIVGVIVFSYLLIFIAAFGFVIFSIAFIRAKLLQRKIKETLKKQGKPSPGRVINYDEID